MNSTRIEKLGEYLELILETLNSSYKKINADFLGLDINNYSLDKIPTASTVETWITGDKICRDVYSFRSRNVYSSDRIENLKNIGFFEQFESIIQSNNDGGILPDIQGIQSIECLNCGSVNTANTKTCEMDIQIQVTYKEERNETNSK